MRHKSWNKDWSRSHSVHTQFRMLSLTAIETLLETLKLADTSFQQIVRNVNSEWLHEYANTNFLYLHQDLAIPDRPTVSFHFYYQAAQWQCSNMIDMLSNNELTGQVIRIKTVSLPIPTLLKSVRLQLLSHLMSCNWGTPRHSRAT